MLFDCVFDFQKKVVPTFYQNDVLIVLRYK